MTFLAESKYFPPVDTADKDGLVAFGGSLGPEWLLDAYKHGIFPWPIFDDEEMLAWWSPDPRAVIEFDRFGNRKKLPEITRIESGNLTASKR